MHNIEFLFIQDDRVQTPFNKDGIIRMCGHQDGRNQYYVQTEDNNSWYYEDELILAN